MTPARRLTVVAILSAFAALIDRLPSDTVLPMRASSLTVTAAAAADRSAPLATMTTSAPLGRAVIGGLLFATFATLFFVPAVFSILHRNTRVAPLPDAQQDEISAMSEPLPA